MNTLHMELNGYLIRDIFGITRTFNDLVSHKTISIINDFRGWQTSNDFNHSYREKFGDHHRMYTLPETNITPENRPSQKETIVFQRSFSGASC